MEKAFKVRRINAELMKNKRLVYCFKMANVSEKKSANLPQRMEQ